MNFLDRFAALEKECEEIVEQNQHQPQEDSDDVETLSKTATDEKIEWIEKKPMKPEDKVKLITNVVKTVPLSTLVWATLLNIRGGAAFVFARICTKAESAHYTFHSEELDEFGLIPDGKVVVEYLSLPDNFPQYAVKDPATLKAYNEPIKKSSEMSSIDQWHPENCTHLLKTIFRRKYSSNVAQYIFDNASTVANEFLRLALQHEKEETEFTNDSAIEVVDSRAAAGASCEAPEKSVDMSLYVLSNSPAKRISLKAGTWIGYQDKIFKTTKVTQIIEIPKQTRSTSSTSSLVLANGDILFKHDLICKLSDDPSTHSAALDQPGYHTLDEYRLVSGKLTNIKTIHQEMAEETKEQLSSLADEGLVVLNRKSQKRKSTPTKSSPQSKKKGK